MKKWFTITDKELVEDWQKKRLNLISGLPSVPRISRDEEEAKYRMLPGGYKTIQTYKE